MCKNLTFRTFCSSTLSLYNSSIYFMLYNFCIEKSDICEAWHYTSKTIHTFIFVWGIFPGILLWLYLCKLWKQGKTLFHCDLLNDSSFKNLSSRCRYYTDCTYAHKRHFPSFPLYDLQVRVLCSKTKECRYCGRAAETGHWMVMIQFASPGGFGFSPVAQSLRVLTTTSAVREGNQGYSLLVHKCLLWWI